MFTRIAAGASGDLCGEQVGNNSVFVGRPHGAVAPQKRRSRALLAAEADAAIDEPLDKPLEAHRHFDQSAVQAAATRSIMLLLTMVLPTATALDHCGRFAKRYEIATER